MKIKKGYTRIVFIFSNVVVKIPRAWHIRFVFLYFFKKEYREMKNRPKFRNIKDIVRYCFNGWYCNRLEYLYSKKRHNSGALLHILNSFFFSFVLIQPRREVLNENNPKWGKASRLLWESGLRDFDALRACNYCSNQGYLQILDYGRPETIFVLENGFLETIEGIKLL